MRTASDETEQRLLHVLRWADLSIANWQFGLLPDPDVIWPTMLAIDTEEWAPVGEATSEADGSNAPVSIIHAPNHRRIKGTEHLERAVEELRADGLRIDLVVLPGVGNEELRAKMLAADIAGDQFLAGYAMYAVEAMALGKPVLTGPLPVAVRDSAALRDCPLVITGPDRLREDLRRLVESPRLRRELGEAGRDFVLRHHSYEAVGHDWDALVMHAWLGTPLAGRDARLASGERDGSR